MRQRESVPRPNRNLPESHFGIRGTEKRNDLPDVWRTY